jgi:putative Mn2+ efflux pump MntP
MLALIVKNKRIVQGTGMSFLAIGTTIHAFNVANLMTPTLSHTWSAVAITGFVLTASSQIGGNIAKKVRRIRKPKPDLRSCNNRDVVLP